MSHCNNSIGVILDADSLGADIDLGPIQSALQECRSYHTNHTSTVSERLKDCSVAITNKVEISAELMAQHPQLKLICVSATGTNNIDLAAAEKFGITVKNVANYSTESVAQHTFTLLLALSAQLQRYHAAVNHNRWSASPFFCLLNFPMTELAGKTLGIIGYGNTGRAVARIGRAFGLKILIAESLNKTNKPNKDQTERVPLSELLQHSDIVSLHCPLSDASRNLISQPELQQMKKTALLINCARGGIVDESALLQTLKNGEIAGAALDVLEQEPPSTSHPLISYQQQHSNLLITPHIAWSSKEARQRLITALAKNIVEFVG